MSVGSVLAEQREKLGIEIGAMATYLRIRLPYLQAIETDAFDDLPPGNAYRIGFIKSYAAALDLDVDEVVALYRKEQDGTQKIPLRVRMPLKESHGSTLGLLGILAALLVAGWIAWACLHHTGDRAVADAVPPVPDRLQPQAAVAAASIQAETTDSGESDEARDEAYNKAKAAPAAQAAPPAAAPTGAPISTVSGPWRVEIATIADTWVQIKSDQGVVYTGVMHAGDTYQIPDQPGWTMTAGNAAGVTLVVDGRASAPLGAAGAVIRDLPLDAAGLGGHH
jgi:cytoskeleton protein RodZ